MIYERIIKISPLCYFVITKKITLHSPHKTKTGYNMISNNERKIK